MAEEKSEIKFRVHLSGNKYILGNGDCYWVAREDKLTKKSGENKGDEYIRRVVLSGYHRDFMSLMDSYYEKSLRNSGIDGEIADLVKLMKKTKAEIRTWFGKWDDAWDI